MKMSKELKEFLLKGFDKIFTCYLINERLAYQETRILEAIVRSIEVEGE